ncbi:MAG: 2OG-Fe(II) oxygenase, partial [Azonexus sp.]|nr:2OG-Fe(II) oxygenase [Azonexus sp.]
MPADAPSADKAALARIGAAVRRRLADDPAVHRIAVEQAEIFAVGGFLSPGECTHLMAMIDSVARPSSTFDPENTHRYRTSYSGDVDSGDSFVRMIERRLCDLLGIDPAWGETVQGQRYEPGQEFQAHHDWFDAAAAYWPGEMKRGGQRSWTAMAYLNDIAEGGATVFDLIGVSVQPQAGALLIWNNARPDGTPNPQTRHAALPVV